MKKLSIYAYSTKDDCITAGPIAVPINPDQFTHKKAISLTESNSADSAGSDTQYAGKDPDTVSFELQFDGTGVIADNVLDVDLQIATLMGVMFAYEGESHKNNCLVLTWGNWRFLGHAESCNITYSLFKPDGTPLRAKMSLSFKEHTPEQKDADVASRRSPDLTHAETVREGDSLALFCEDVYDDHRHYINVAKYNGLVNFRNLESGSTIVLPPIER